MHKYIYVIPFAAQVSPGGSLKLSLSCWSSHPELLEEEEEVVDDKAKEAKRIAEYQKTIERYLDMPSRKK